MTKTRLTDIFDKLELPESASAGFDRRAESCGETALEKFRG